MKMLLRAVVVSCLMVSGAHAYEDVTQEWRTSIDYRDGKPDVRLIRQGRDAQGNRSSMELNKSSDRYTLRYNNGLDIRLQNRGSNFKDIKFDIRSK